MRRISFARPHILLIAGLVCATAAVGQASDKPLECKPKKFIEGLWKDAGKGDLLTAEGWRQASALYLHPVSFSKNRELQIISGDWKVTGCTIQGNIAQVVVDFWGAGRIDDALRYVPTENNSFVKTQKQYHFIMAPAHWHAYKSDGKTTVIDREQTGPPVWQIEDAPELPWTSVNTAVRYVLVNRNSTLIPSHKLNADRTLRQLMKIGMPTETVLESGNSPEQVVEHLWIEATNGALLAKQGGDNVAPLFTRPAGAFDDKTVQVVDNDWAINDTTIVGDTAKVVVGYADAGQIDALLRYSPARRTRFFKIGLQYSLAFVSEDPSPGSNGQRVGDKTGQLPKWKIVGSPNMFPGAPWTTVNTAIRYVLEKRSQTEDPVIKKNADNTLAALLRYR